MADFTPRQLLVAEYFLLYPDDDELSDAPEIVARRDELTKQYLEALAPVPVSRCPFTGEVVHYAVDTVSLDGPFWDVRLPKRHPPPHLPRTLLGVTGALQLTGDAADIPYAKFLSRPGPEVPFVLPRLIEHPDVLAVVSAFGIGPHRGFPIAYFLRPGADGSDLPAIDEWGSDLAYKRDASGNWLAGASITSEGSYDYEIAPWIEAGKLRWIDGYDASLTLREGLQGCPYPNQPGHREVTRIEDLEVWWPSKAPAGENDDDDDDDDDDD